MRLFKLKSLLIPILAFTLFSCNKSTNTTTNHIHTPGQAVKTNEVAPTCTHDGSYLLITRCEICNEIIESKRIVIDALGHDLIHHDSQAATCVEGGYLAYDTCSRCSYSTYEKTNPLGHEFDDNFCCTRCDYCLEKLFSYDVSANGDESIIADIYKDDEHSSYTLNITGSGMMKVYSNPNAPGYRSIIKQIDQIIVREGITYIGNYSFWGAWSQGKNVTVSLPNSLTEIGLEAFGGLTIKSINLPNNLTIIRSYAFSDTTISCEIIFPHSITTIEDSAFSHANLHKVVFPDKVFNGSGLFGDPYLRLSIGNIRSYEGCYYLPSKTNPYFMLLSSTEEANTLHPDTRIIHQRAFVDRFFIVDLIIPENVFAIGQQCFAVSSNLHSIEIPENVTRIEDHTFNGCQNLSHVIINSHLTYLGRCPFLQCTALELIEYVGSQAEWQAIPKHELAFMIASNSGGEAKTVTIRCSDGDFSQPFFKGNYS